MQCRRILYHLSHQGSPLPEWNQSQTFLVRNPLWDLRTFKGSSTTLQVKFKLFKEAGLSRSPDRTYPAPTGCFLGPESSCTPLLPRLSLHMEPPLTTSSGRAPPSPCRGTHHSEQAVYSSGSPGPPAQCQHLISTCTQQVLNDCPNGWMRARTSAPCIRHDPRTPHL